MAENLEQSETQTLLAGRMLVGLGLAGALGGLLSGYATARRLSQRTSRLLVRVQAVQAHLNQDVGAMTVEAPRHVGELDTELDLIVSRVKDVCQRLQGQERELLRAEQLAAVGQLAAGVAHEIRNPLTGIKILVEAALRPTGPSDLTPTDLGLIRDEILRLERTVQGLLDFARTPPLNPQRLDIGVLVVESVEILQRRAEAKSVVIHTESSATPILAEVDRDQFLSLLTNLLLNAIEAVPFGGVVTVNSSETPSGMIQVVVADDGPGIAPSVIDKLFTPFATTKSSGTGLGLAIAMRVAKDHGGELAAENRIEGGARFTLKLPVARS